MLFRHNHISDAIPFFEKAAELLDSDWHNPSLLMTCYAAINDEQRLRTSAKTTLERSERAIAKEPTNGQALAAGSQALIILGDQERARDWINRAMLLDPDNLVMRYNLGCGLAAHLGAFDEALDTLEPFFDRVNSSTHMRHIDVDPDLDGLRDHPRFKKMLASAKERLGLQVATE
jgi:adenylate cyclase